MIVEEQAERDQIEWLGTTAAAKRLGITTRTLYRFIDEGYIAAYRMGRVIRVKGEDIASYIDSCRIEPGTISHLYPEVAPRSSDPAPGSDGGDSEGGDSANPSDAAPGSGDSEDGGDSEGGDSANPSDAASGSGDSDSEGGDSSGSG